MNFIFIATGWISLIVLPFIIKRYAEGEGVYTKWGIFYGDSARDALVGYILLAILFGSYSIYRLVLFLKKRK